MTPTPSAREPQDIIVTPEWIAGVRINWGLDRMTPGDAAQHWYEVSNGAGVPCGIVAALGHTLDAYDALAAEREAITRLAGSLQDDVAALREAEESLTRQRDEAEQRRIMADECLAMIYQKLVQIKGEESMKACPPMFYQEAIHNINADRLRAERERDSARRILDAVAEAAGFARTYDASQLPGKVTFLSSARDAMLSALAYIAQAPNDEGESCTVDDLKGVAVRALDERAALNAAPADA